MKSEHWVMFLVFGSVLALIVAVVALVSGLKKWRAAKRLGAARQELIVSFTSLAICVGVMFVFVRITAARAADETKRRRDASPEWTARAFLKDARNDFVDPRLPEELRKDLHWTWGQKRASQMSGTFDRGVGRTTRATAAWINVVEVHELAVVRATDTAADVNAHLVVAPWGAKDNEQYRFDERPMTARLSMVKLDGLWHVASVDDVPGRNAHLRRATITAGSRSLELVRVEGGWTRASASGSADDTMSNFMRRVDQVRSTTATNVEPGAPSLLFRIDYWSHDGKPAEFFELLGDPSTGVYVRVTPAGRATLPYGVGQRISQDLAVVLP